MPTLHDPDQRRRGLRDLRSADPALADLIRRFGDPWKRPRVSRFQLLCHIIIGQQLSTKAAATIGKRLREAGGGVLRPQALLDLKDEEIRACGLSRQKLASLRDLSRHVEEGALVPGSLGRLSDEAVVERLTAVRGIGTWSADMFLLFGLGRPDVWATGDLGLRHAVQRLDGAPEALHEPAMIARAESWRPWRGLASVYLWKSLDSTPAT